MTDPLTLAGLLCSRLCHDLVGPVGAVVNGVELLADADEDDDELRDQSIALIGESAAELSARLRFFRLAFGAVHDDGAITVDELAGLVAPVMQGRRIALAIEGGRDGVPRARARLAALMALAAADCLPRGGRMVLVFEGDLPRIRVSGDRFALPASHAAALADAGAEPEARTAPLALVLHLAAPLGRRLVAAADEAGVDFRLV
ncbi:histidine phosphotransferase family protein [Zavarzinia compransoris]|nr:histidine phosphotransferase family protein [Zavarzinia compransoris]TDP46922.1 histidine phosphotransferase ChpT [Zavarzinia compransoris]